jgi:hypothetical protein
MNKILVLLVGFFTIMNSNAQDLDFAKLYEKQLVNSSNYSFNDIEAFAKSKNAYHLMSLGYFVDANNIMFSKTKDLKYLDLNLKIINIMFSNKIKDNDKWLMNVNSTNQNSFINGKESITYEGYFSRYFAEFLDIVITNKLYINNQKILISNLKNTFDKWLIRSLAKYHDASNLYHQRLHIAANWGCTALYLYKYTNEVKYKDFYRELDMQLRSSLKEVSVAGHNCYIWNSTYSSRFTTALKNMKNYKDEIQDVSHANHVLNFVIAAHKIEPEVWGDADLVKFSNTLLYIIFKKDNFSDSVDGSSSLNKEMFGTGWKQSDGWMKLIPYNSRLYDIYLTYFLKNNSKINKSTYSLQYIANLYNQQ